MALLFIDFQWGKDKAGYRLVEAEPANPEPVIHPIFKVAFEPTLLSRVAMPQRVVPNGGERIAFQPLKKFDRLYKAFASIRTPKDALHFIRQYGPLTETGPRGEEVKRVLNWAATFRDWLNAGRSRRRQLAERFGEGGIANLQASLIASRSGEVRLRLVPKSLLGALWLQLAQTLAGGKNITACQQCGKLFEAGPGTGRRRDAKCCTDKHRILYNSLKRSRR